MVCLERGRSELKSGGSIGRGIVIAEPRLRRAKGKLCSRQMKESAQNPLRDAGAYIASQNSGAKPSAYLRANAANLIRWHMRRKTGS
jgi:hypothetical protein